MAVRAAACRMGGANGSRERAPDDRLRISIALRHAVDGFRALYPSYDALGDKVKQVILWTLAFFVGLPTALILAICAWIYFANNWHPPKEFAQLFNEGQIIRRGEADAALTEILNKEFPLGTPVKSLKSALYRKGFRERPPPPPGCVSSFEQAEALGLRPPYAVCPDHRDMMEYNWSIGLVCGGNSYVQWTSDQNSLVTRIKGSADTGCL